MTESMEKGMTDKELNQKVKELFEEYASMVSGKTTSYIKTEALAEYSYRILQLIHQRDAELVRALEAEKKYFAQLAMTEDIYAWNEALDKSIKLVQQQERPIVDQKFMEEVAEQHNKDYPKEYWESGGKEKPTEESK